jgi:retron-type reverse transcriptase
MEKQELIKKVHELQNPKDLLSLLNEIKADLLGNKAYPFTRTQFAILCNPNKDTGRYKTFYIPKKSGGKREICAPNGNLKWMQLCLNEIFKAVYEPSPYAMGFTLGRSIVDNARIHTNQHYVYNIDLKDFFPSIEQARLWKRLQLAPFNFNKRLAASVAGLCAMKQVIQSTPEVNETKYILPQGAPTSPLLTNAICDTLDRKLHGLANRFGLHYSRYADDITFSSMHNVYAPDGDFCKELSRIISDQHFRINEKKTRLQHCTQRQEVTGLTVGSKVNVSRKYVKDVRAILHIWKKYGINAAYAVFYPRYISEKCQLHRGEPNLENIISGKLCYLKMVKGDKDPIYIKLNALFEKLTQTTPAVQQRNKIDYIFSMSKVDFEKKLGVSIQFGRRKKDQKVYGHFTLDGRYFVVAVSQNLNIESLPNNVMVSLCRIATPNKDSDSKKEDASGIKTESKLQYLLHKPHFGHPNQQTNVSIPSDIPESLREIVLQMAKTFPDLELVVENEIPNQKPKGTTSDDILDQLVKSNFDLSILP